MDAVPEFHAEAPQATVSEGLAQGPYMAATVHMGFEPATLRMQGTELTTVPACPSASPASLLERTYLSRAPPKLKPSKQQ